MHRHVFATAALALGVAVAAPSAAAQDVAGTRAVSFGIAGGATLPVGDASDFYDTGFNLMGSINVQPAYMPVGARFDVMYHSLGGKDVGIFEAEDLNILAGNANVVLTVSNTGTVRPYVLGGVGIYNLDAGGSSESVTKFGLNGGGGIEFDVGGFNTFVEARLHSIFTEDSKTNVVPVVFGIRF
jgi:opacity protein-like surface antigen